MDRDSLDDIITLCLCVYYSVILVIGKSFHHCICIFTGVARKFVLPETNRQLLLGLSLPSVQAITSINPWVSVHIMSTTTTLFFHSQLPVKHRRREVCTIHICPGRAISTHFRFYAFLSFPFLLHFSKFFG